MRWKSPRQRAYIVLTAVLLMMLTIGCSCGQVFQEWLAQFLEDLTRAIELWIRDLVARFFAQIQQQITDWWEGLWQDLGEEWHDFWARAGQTWRDLWMPIFPPAPVITQPADGLIAGAMNVEVHGTALANGTVTLYRNNILNATVRSDATGRWSIAAVELNSGQNTFTARVKAKAFTSGPSDSVMVTWTGSALGAVPVMTPTIEAGLDTPAWTVELALELLKADANTFYESRRASYTAALRLGLEASRQDAETHRFINVEGPLSFDKHVLTFAVPRDASREAILEALAKAVESAVLDKAVRKTLIAEFTESLELLDLTWTVEAGSRSFDFRYVYVELSRQTLLEYFDPSALAKFRVRLGTELITGLAVAVPTAILAEAIEMGFGFWGRADADSQVQHYYDLAIRAWDFGNSTGAALHWDNPVDNGFDGDMGYRFDTNQEWGMFYLGRAAFYLQGVADPYYTIPDYLPEAKLYALLVRQGVSALASKLITKKLTPVLGRVVGGAQPITLLFTTKEILDWITGLTEVVDAWEITTVHRPYFGHFVEGLSFDYPMPQDRKDMGATNTRAGYPFQSPADFLLHDSLSNWPMYPQERGETPPATFDAASLIDAKAQEFVLGSWTYRNWREITREVAEHAATYVHPGMYGQSDKRVTEGAMIVDNPYMIREVYNYEITDRKPGVWWDAELGTQFRLVLLDGSVITGQVGGQPPVQPINYRYTNTQVLVEDTVWVYVITLDHLNYLAGSDDLAGYAYLDLLAVEGDERHLYAIFDQDGASASDVAPGSWTDLPEYLVGMTGNASLPADVPERDGAARIAAKRLEVGVLATRYLLGAFSGEAPSYRPPEPIVCPADALCTALGSPATLHVRNRAGQHVGPNGMGGFDLGIKGSRYFTSTASGQQIIVIPDADLGEEYTVRVEGTGSGTFDLDVFYGDQRHDRAYRQAYTDVPLIPGTVAEVVVEIAERLPLRLDETGDGTIEQQLAPAQTIDLTNYEPMQRKVPWAIVSGSAAILIVGGLLLFVVLHRRRRRRGPGGPPTPPPGNAVAPVNASMGAGNLACARCGAIALPGARFCLDCGAPLTGTPVPAARICPHCGTAAARPMSRFCQKCGGPL